MIFFSLSLFVKERGEKEAFFLFFSTGHASISASPPSKRTLASPHSSHRALMTGTRRRRREPPRPRAAAVAASSSSSSSCDVVALATIVIFACLALFASVADASRFDSEVGTVGYGANGVVSRLKRDGEETEKERGSEDLQWKAIDRLIDAQSIASS